MKIFLDTADTEIIEKHFGSGLIDGITTNPSLIMKSGRDPEEVYQELKDLGIHDISMEVMGDSSNMIVHLIKDRRWHCHNVSSMSKRLRHTIYISN